jgi:hypothetical protein
MMTRTRIAFSILIFFILFTGTAYSQDFDCMTKLKIRYPSPSYEYNELSKSAICRTGEKYEYKVFLNENINYRLSFFASTVFNNKIRFKIISTSTGELLMDLPGEALSEGESSVLRAYFDEGKNKLVHPFFDILPKVSGEYKIIIELESEQNKSLLDEEKIFASNIEKKGCVSVYVQSKLSETEGFN